jgi:hypothetical protein
MFPALLGLLSIQACEGAAEGASHKVQLNQKQLIVGEIRDYTQQKVRLTMGGVSAMTTTSATGGYWFEMKLFACGEMTIEAPPGDLLHTSSVDCDGAGLRGLLRLPVLFLQENLSPWSRLKAWLIPHLEDAFQRAHKICLDLMESQTWTHELIVILKSSSPWSRLKAWLIPHLEDAFQRAHKMCLSLVESQTWTHELIVILKTSLPAEWHPDLTVGTPRADLIAVGVIGFGLLIIFICASLCSCICGRKKMRFPSQARTQPEEECEEEIEEESEEEEEEQLVLTCYDHGMFLNAIADENNRAVLYIGNHCCDEC